MYLKNEGTQTTYTVLKPEKKSPPTVVFSKKALAWIECIVEAHDLEVGFYGTVEPKEDYAFYVKDIFYPKHQAMNGATCEISAEGEAEIMEWLFNHNRGDDIQNMILWGHSHHKMGVFASGQDQTQALEKLNNNKANVVRLIVNKDGLMSISFFDYNAQIQFDHVKWYIEESNFDNDIKKLEKIQEEINSKEALKLKLDNIFKILTCDEEKTEIMKKVLELKKVNEPKPIENEYGINKSYTSYGDNTNIYRNYDYLKNNKKCKKKDYVYTGNFLSNDVEKLMEGYRGF